MRTATRGKLKTVTQRGCRRLRSARLGSGRWEHCQLQGGMTAVCAAMQRSGTAQRRICTQSYK